jgi:hypothetical protein
VISASDWNVVQDNREYTFNYAGENNPNSKFDGFQKKNQINFPFCIFFPEHVDLG